jgi:hypothetical protein
MMVHKFCIFLLIYYINEIQKLYMHVTFDLTRMIILAIMLYFLNKLNAMQYNVCMHCCILMLSIVVIYIY